MNNVFCRNLSPEPCNDIPSAGSFDFLANFDIPLASPPRRSPVAGASIHAPTATTSERRRTVLASQQFSKITSLWFPAKIVRYVAYSTQNGRIVCWIAKFIRAVMPVERFPAFWGRCFALFGSLWNTCGHDAEWKRDSGVSNNTGPVEWGSLSKCSPPKICFFLGRSNEWRISVHVEERLERLKILGYSSSTVSYK